MNDIEELRRITKKVVDSKVKDYATFYVSVSSGGTIVIEYTQYDKYGGLKIGDMITINKED